MPRGACAAHLWLLSSVRSSSAPIHVSFSRVYSSLLTVLPPTIHNSIKKTVQGVDCLTPTREIADPPRRNLILEQLDGPSASSVKRHRDVTATCSRVLGRACLPPEPGRFQPRRLPLHFHRLPPPPRQAAVSMATDKPARSLLQYHQRTAERDNDIAWRGMGPSLAEAAFRAPHPSAAPA